MEGAINRLTYGYKGVIFDGGERAEGFWIKAVHEDGNWAWERWRMSSAAAAYYFAQVALAECHGA